MSTEVSSLVVQIFKYLELGMGDFMVDLDFGLNVRKKHIMHTRNFLSWEW